MGTAIKISSAADSTGKESQFINVPSLGIDVGDVMAGAAFPKGSAGTLTPGAGQRGQVIAASVADATNAAATTTYLALSSVALTPGIWSVSGVAQLTAAGATLTSADALVAVGTTTAADTGTVAGQTLLGQTQDAVSTLIVVPPFLATITSATTYFLNVNATYSDGQPTWVGSISAVRIA